MLHSFEISHHTTAPLSHIDALAEGCALYSECLSDYFIISFRSSSEMIVIPRD